MTSIQLLFIVSIILFIVIYCNESIRFFKYPQHVLITFILQSQIINHNIYINSSPHDLQWVSYRYHDKRKSPINGLFTPFMKLCLLFKLILTLGLRDLSSCFVVHICAFYSSYLSYFAFLCTSSKIFRAKLEPCTSYEYLFAKVIGQVISNAFLIFSINCNSSPTVL